MRLTFSAVRKPWYRPSTLTIGPIWQAPMQPYQISTVTFPSGLVSPFCVIPSRSKTCSRSSPEPSVWQAAPSQMV